MEALEYQTSVKIAGTDAEIDEARALYRKWLDWHWNADPAEWPRERNPMSPERFEKIAEDPPRIHARPAE